MFIGKECIFGCKVKSHGLHPTCQVAIMSNSGKYVTALPNGTVNCMSDEISSFEIWTVTFVSMNKVTFRSSHQKYLRAQINSTTEATRNDAGNCETFTVKYCNDGKFAFKSHFGTYLMVDDGSLLFNRPCVGDREMFCVIPQSDTNTDSQEKISSPSPGNPIQ